MSLPNLGEPEFDELREVDGFRAHQLVNRTAAPVRFLSMSTHGVPDIVFYPDSGKVGVGERLPRGGGFWEQFRIADAVDYYDGET